MSQTPEIPPPPVPRFRLRTMLILIAVCLVPIAWIGNRGHRQTRLTKELSKMDAEWMYRHERPSTHGARPWGTSYLVATPRVPNLENDYFGTISVVNIYTYGNFGQPATDETLQRIAAVRSIEALDVSSSRISDEGLSHLTQMPRLGSLALHSHGITDAGIAHLKALHSLRELWIACPLITDTSLAHLAEMTELRVLHIRAPKVTDAGISKLNGNKALVQLGLWGTQVSDRGLSILLDMPRLTELTIEDAPITDRSLQYMKEIEYAEFYNTQITKTAADNTLRNAIFVNVAPAAPVRPAVAYWGNLPPVVRNDESSESRVEADSVTQPGAAR